MTKRQWLILGGITVLCCLIFGTLGAILLTMQSPTPVLQQQATSMPVSSAPPFALVPFNYVITKDVEAGWNKGIVYFAIANASGRLLDPPTQVSLQSTVSVETQENKEYQGETWFDFYQPLPSNAISGAKERLAGDLYGSFVSWGASQRDLLPLPPNFVHRTTQGDYHSKYPSPSPYWVSFRFAYAAHPTKVKIRFAPQGTIANIDVDLSSVPLNPPIYKVDQVKPLSALRQALVLDEPGKLIFQTEGKCLVTIAYNSGPFCFYVMLPYSVMNRNQLDQESKTILLGHAVLSPYGAWTPSLTELDLKVGPGQQEKKHLELFFGCEEPLPDYLMLYEPVGNHTAYQSVSVYALQCEDKRPSK